MELGRFSVSLAVQDLAKSLQFYQALGFEQVAGDAAENWVILQNGEAKIGLFHGMFEDNILTFNPAGDMESLHAKASKLGASALQPGFGEGGSFFTLKDPDGNDLLVDCHASPPSE